MLSWVYLITSCISTAHEMTHVQTSAPNSSLEEECEKPCENPQTCGSSLTLPNGKYKKTNSATLPFDRKEANSNDHLARLKQEKLTLAMEVQAQKVEITDKNNL